MKLPDTAYDPIELEDYPINAIYNKNNSEFFVFLEKNTAYMVNRVEFKHYYDFFYACKTANPAKYRGSNVIMKKKYIKLYPFNTVVEVPSWWNRKDIASPKIFKLEPTGSIPAIVSNNVYTRRTGIVSADHCNHRSPLKTYKLVALKKSASQTTKKPTTKKETKASLMKEAQALGIKGRSKMNKGQLKEAIKNFSSTNSKPKRKASRKPKRKASRKLKRKTSRKPKRKASRKPKRKTSRKPKRKASRKPKRKTSRKPKVRKAPPSGIIKQHNLPVGSQMIGADGKMYIVVEYTVRGKQVKKWKKY
jgi:hypothetical protein